MYKFIFFNLFIATQLCAQNNDNYNKVFVDNVSIINTQKTTDTSIIEYSGERNYVAKKVSKYYEYSDIVLSESYNYFNKFSAIISSKMRDELEKKLKQENLIDTLKSSSSFKPNDLTAQITITKLNIIVIGYGFSFRHVYHMEAKIAMLNKKDKEVYSYIESYRSTPRNVSKYMKLINSSTNSYDETKLDLLYDTIIRQSVNALLTKAHLDDFSKQKDKFKDFDPNDPNQQSQPTEMSVTVKKESDVDSSKIELVSPVFDPITLKIKNKKLNQDLTEAINSVIVVKIGKEKYSGIILSDDGYILTSCEPLDDDTTTKCEVIFPDGKTYDPTIVRINKAAGLLLLKIHNNNYTPIILNGTTEVKITNDIYAVGSTGSNELGQSISKGIVSGNRVIEKKTILQLNAKINTWQIGGGLFLPNGYLVGMLYSKLSGYSVEGIGFALTNSFIIKSLNLKYE